jgi:glycosyltransferase involved in cell wall biosynthesis
LFWRGLVVLAVVFDTEVRPKNGAGTLRHAQPRALRILFVANMWPDDRLPWKGAFIRAQADSLRKLGIAVDVLPVRAYYGRRAYAAAAARIARLNGRAAFDVVHAHYGYSGILARLQLRAPVVISYCGSDLLGYRGDSGSVTLRGHVEVAAFRRLARLAAATITKSEEMAQVLPDACRRRNHVIPNGVDLERFEPMDRREARRQLGWSESELAVLFVGDPRLPVKNHALAEAVCDRVAAVMPEARLRVAQGLAPELMPLCMSAADALLVTSRAEGSPNMVKEAMAAELPVVSTPVGDVAERLRGVPGCHVRPPEPRALAEALEAALRHGRVPEARAAVADISLQRVAERIAAVYEAVA